jgi:NTP pyrophosphatase (non-canonical NTP hydrolase)
MNTDEFERSVRRTMPDDYPEDTEGFRKKMNFLLGLFGEYGEVVELIKKETFHQHERNPEKLTEELGDVLWYLTALCIQYGISLDEVMNQNMKKLQKRYPKGFSSADSINRVV